MAKAILQYVSGFGAFCLTTVLSLASPSLAGPLDPPKADPAQRAPFTAAELDAARIARIPNARVWGDDPRGFCRMLDGVKAGGSWLSLSGGGENGAFGAGLLSGWSRAGKRDEHAVISGVSTGALIAPYAFLGRSYDETLERMYTKTDATEVFEIGNRVGDAMFDTWPLAEAIDKRITPQFLAKIAAEHRKGRRLLVVTTNLDAGRPVVWNMGAIAAAGGPKAEKLFQDVLLASSSIPGLFPPVLIDSAVKGRALPLSEMHADGGASAPFYVLPRPMLTARSAERPEADCAPGRVDVIMNGKLGLDLRIVDRKTFAIADRGVSTLLRQAERMSLDETRLWAERAGVDLRVWAIPDAFAAPRNGPFDSKYMKPLFEEGERIGKSEKSAGVGARTNK